MTYTTEHNFVISANKTGYTNRNWTLTAFERIKWAYDQFGECLALISSFGPQSIVTLSLARAVNPHIPVVMINVPGPEYDVQRQYRDYLKISLKLNLHAVQAEGLDQKKVALYEYLSALGVQATIDGIRWDQTENRAQKEFLEHDPNFPNIKKIHPLVDWSDERTYEFIEQLPVELRHPNYKRGVQSVGGALLSAEQAKTECGLHI